MRAVIRVNLIYLPSITIWKYWSKQNYDSTILGNRSIDPQHDIPHVYISFSFIVPAEHYHWPRRAFPFTKIRFVPTPGCLPLSRRKLYILHTIFKSKSFAVTIHARVCLNPRRAGKSISPKALHPIETEIIASFGTTHAKSASSSAFTRNLVLGYFEYPRWPESRWLPFKFPAWIFRRNAARMIKSALVFARVYFWYYILNILCAQSRVCSRVVEELFALKVACFLFEARSSYISLMNFMKVGFFFVENCRHPSVSGNRNRCLFFYWAHFSNTKIL